MKQGTLITRIVVVVLFLAVLAYLGVYLWQGLSDPYQLVVTYTYEMDDAASLTGVVIRSEEVIRGRTALAEVLPQEGERLSAGSAVALVYQDAQALASRREARKLELELEQLNYSMRRGDTVADAKELDAQLVDTLAKLKSETSTGSFEAVEEWGLDVRSIVVKRTGLTATSAQSLAQLQSVSDDLQSQLDQLNATSIRNTQRITVDRGGVFSGLADGFETTLYPDMLEEFTAGDLTRLSQQETTQSDDALGKLITDNTWYYAAAIEAADAQRLTQGRSYTLAFSGDFNAELSMKLERLGPQEADGRHLAVFSSDRYLNRVTLARFVDAKLVFQRYTGVRIPDTALRVRDNDDGTTTPGVYTLVGRQVEFKSVEVIREGEGFYLVRGTNTNRKVLRPGDTIVLSSQELYEGKVVA